MLLLWMELRQLVILCRLVQACAKQFILVPSPEIDVLNNPNTVNTRYRSSFSIPTYPQITTINPTFNTHGRINPIPSTIIKYLIILIYLSRYCCICYLESRDEEKSMRCCLECMIFRLSLEEYIARQMVRMRNSQQHRPIVEAQLGNLDNSNDENITNCNILENELIVEAGIFCNLQQSSSIQAINLPETEPLTRINIKLAALYILTPNTMPQKSANTYNKLLTILYPTYTPTHSASNTPTDAYNLRYILSLIQLFTIGCNTNADIDNTFTITASTKYLQYTRTNYLMISILLTYFPCIPSPILALMSVVRWELV